MEQKDTGLEKSTICRSEDIAVNNLQGAHPARRQAQVLPQVCVIAPGVSVSAPMELFNLAQKSWLRSGRWKGCSIEKGLIPGRGRGSEGGQSSAPLKQLRSPVCGAALIKVLKDQQHQHHNQPGTASWALLLTC
jgi:hypothetical protein